ncbi:MAG: hypothetical protein WCH07_11840, partial [Deltaproteobacteria bacterium]
MNGEIKAAFSVCPALVIIHAAWIHRLAIRLDLARLFISFFDMTGEKKTSQVNRDNLNLLIVQQRRAIWLIRLIHSNPSKSRSTPLMTCR